MVVEITYRGIRVTRGKLEGDGDPGFLPFEAPLPVGTRVMVHPEGEPSREAIVTQIVEQDASAQSAPGMKLRWAPALPNEAATSTHVSTPPPVEPADSPTRTISMPAMSLPDEVEPPDSPRQTLTMDAIAVRGSEAESDPEGDDGGRKKKRRKR
jgi:hypothetical protein